MKWNENVVIMANVWIMAYNENNQSNGINSNERSVKWSVNVMWNMCGNNQCVMSYVVNNENGSIYM